MPTTPNVPAIRPAMPIDLKEVLKEAAPQSGGISFLKMVFYFILFFLLLNLLQTAFETYKKKQLQKKINHLRVGDRIIINSTIEGKIHKIDHKEIYVLVDNGESIVPVKKEVIINIKVL